jgi:hypothetical protein
MSFSSVVHKVTPWLAAAASVAVPGAGPIIQLAAKALSMGLGTTVKAEPQSIENAIATAMANPDQLATLKKIDDDFALQMRTLGIQELTVLACIYMLGFRSLPDSGHDVLMMLLGTVAATYKDVYGYFFGSSAGSDAKTAIMANEKINGGK